MAAGKHLSPGAQRQKALRERMGKLGMTIPRIYMTADEQAMVRTFLHHCRGERTEQLIEGMDFSHMHAKWTVPTLFDALKADTARQDVLAGIRLHGVPLGIELGLTRYGGQLVRLSVSDEEIFVTTVLCGRSAVKQPARFNEACLRLGPTLPLSNVGLVGDDYVLFGQLSAHSPLANIVEELDVLGRNAVESLEALSALMR
ncbi:DUF2170 family protein [Dyella sp. A6]|uniref:DUF2170 family protein n=1 Tax=Dyella aluminiiresistens TaxID=3069105 RepID=UPI002E777ACB|nr:DUF2170 family protein [Dyella sp. A6]